MKRKTSRGRPHERRALIRALIDVCRRLAAKGFVAATDGNVSARMPGGTILITRAGINKGMVGEEDFVEVTADGSPVSGAGTASTETGMHLLIYRERTDVGSVVHAHPVYATGFAAARIPLDSCVLPEMVVAFGAIPLAPYATPSTPEVAESIAPLIRQTDAILLANHGVVTCGRDPLEAYFRMEKVEHTAQILLVSRALGGAVPLSAAELDKLRQVSVASYGISMEHHLPCKQAKR